MRSISSPVFETLIDVVRSLVIIFGLLTGMAYMTWFERRAISRMQVRIGPNRVGPEGLLQPLADALKLFFKEDVRPGMADRFLYPLAPGISLVAALAAFAVIPIGPALSIGGRQIDLIVQDMPVALLYLIGASSLGVYGIVLGGWSSGSKYSLLGALRGGAQVVSYELVLGLALVGVVLVSGSLSVSDIVTQQARSVPFVILQPLGFLLYFTAAIAETNRAPFDLPEAEQELVAGYHTEYSGFRFGMYYIAEYVNVLTVSAIAATVFFGGWTGPFNQLPGPWWLLIKMTFFAFVFVWIRGTLPRLRYDQLMRLSWGLLLPLGLFNVLITAVMIVAFSGGALAHA
jgi:NADH-quinone oxidoreductase subunit H